MRFMQTESVLQTKNRSELAKKSVFCSPDHELFYDKRCRMTQLSELK